MTSVSEPSTTETNNDGSKYLPTGVSQGLGTLRALVIGVESYADAPLRGCQEDALAIRNLLISGLRCRPENIETLLSPLAQGDAQVRRATAKNIRLALDHLDKVAVAGDRVFIYFSGHGGSFSVPGPPRRNVEALLPDDFRSPGAPIFDVELNSRLAGLTQKSVNVTLILDCCHSGGATKDIRACRLGVPKYVNLDITEALTAQSPGVAVPADSNTSQALVLAACHSDEVAYVTGMTPHDGASAFTIALVRTLRSVDSVAWNTTAWRTVWSKIISAVAPAQYPLVIGDDRRSLAGWSHPVNSGSLLVEPAGDRYRIHGGALLGISPGSVVSLRATSLDDPEKVSEIGRVRVEEVTPTEAWGVSHDGPIAWGPGLSGEVSEYGAPLLSYALEGDLADNVRQELASEASVLRVSPELAEVLVKWDKGEWVLCDEYFGRKADDMPEFPRFGMDELVRMLRHAARYRLPLRLANQCLDLPGVLTCRALAFVDGAGAATPMEELPRKEGTYVVAPNTRFCLELGNAAAVTLHVSMLNVSSDGGVQLLDEVTVPKTSTQRVWRQQIIGKPFYLDGNPGMERLIIVGTTQRGVSFRALVLPSMNSVLDEYRSGSLGPKGFAETEAVPATRWTATRVLLRQGGHR